MILFHGTGIKNWKPQMHIKSRYGFPALFATNNIKLAELYAISDKPTGGVGFVYRFKVKGSFVIIDFNGKITHTPEFRNIVFEKASYNTNIIVENCRDYPSEKHKYYQLSEVVIIRNFYRIDYDSIELIKEI